MTESRKAATQAGVRELASALELDEAAYRRALRMAGLLPGREDWLRYVSVFLLAIGVLLVVAGVTAFFAANWTELGYFSKFALVELGIAAGCLAAWRLGLDALAGKAALFAAAFLVGVLLAVFGQVYQTGADPYGLFVAWALLVLPWALVGRQAGLWILELVLMNVALILYWTQVLYPPDGWWSLGQLLGPAFLLATAVMDWRLANWLFALNALSLVAWELLARRGIGWMQGPAFPRVGALLALATVVPPTLVLVFGAMVEERLGINVVSPVLYVLATAACLYYYRFSRRDLFILTACLSGAVLVFTSLCIRYLPEGDGSLLLLAIVIMAEVAAVAWWLRQVARAWEEEA